MESVTITYRILLQDGRTEKFDYQLTENGFDLVAKPIDSPPEWAKLSHQKCPHCPLSESEHPYCPLALQLVDIVDRFHDTRSIDQVEMEVTTEERTVIQKTDIQKAITSILDLIFPASACPKTEYMKPMSRFHLPLASEEETVFRVTGMFLLAQFLSSPKKGTLDKFDFKGLIEIYGDLHKLNTSVARRLKNATRSDSLKNAITLLDMYSTLVPMLLEDGLDEMQPFFKAYLNDSQISEPETQYFEKFKAMSLEIEKNKKDERPWWMKQLDPDYVFPEDREEEEEPEVEIIEETEADRILKKSKYELSLEPINDPEEDADLDKNRTVHEQKIIPSKHSKTPNSG